MFDGPVGPGTPSEVFALIEGLTNLERGGYRPRQYRLERMTRLLSAFGNPHNDLRIVHIAGSKGKGSTASFIAATLQASGRSVGLYLSPHVSDYRERISQAGTFLSDDLYVDQGRHIAAYLRRLEDSGLPREEWPTTFELLTLLAFLCFRAAGYQWAVIETGIGGRLDATNVVAPEVTVITPIELEHTEYLGTTIEEIAAEKAGIIKQGVPTVIGRLAPAAREVITTVAEARNSTVYELAELTRGVTATVTPRGTEAQVEWTDGRTQNMRLRLLGRAQVDNACVASLACRVLDPELSDDVIAAALPATCLPGRMEVLDANPPLVLDGAHTPESVRTSLDAFRLAFGGETGAVLIFGAAVGKKIPEMAEILGPAFDSVYVTTPGTFKESRPAEIAQDFRRFNERTQLVPDPAEALQAARREAGEQPILVTGSFYLAGEIRRAAGG